MGRYIMDKQRERLNSALNLMRRMPPSLAENSLAGLLDVAPEISDELLTRIDQPLQVETNPKTGKKCILCEFNRDGDSHRDHNSNEYFPEFQGFTPNRFLRNMEELANKLFDIYRQLYFEDGSVSSVYFFDTDKANTNTFGACWLIHKEINNSSGLKKGLWDSVHIFEICPVKDKPDLFTYKLTSSVLMAMTLENDVLKPADLSGARTQQDHKQLKVPQDENREGLHVANMGKMLEDNELRIRNSLERIYIDKTRAVINGMRTYKSKNDKNWAKVAESINQVK